MFSRNIFKVEQGSRFFLQLSRIYNKISVKLPLINHNVGDFTKYFSIAYDFTIFLGFHAMRSDDTALPTCDLPIFIMQLNKYFYVLQFG